MKRILLVDDDVDIHAFVRRLLASDEFQVRAASDGEAGLRVALEWDPDLVILDVLMPRMDGWTMGKALRSRRQTALTPIIFLTSLDSQDDALHGYTLGADDYLPKDRAGKELKSCIDGVFRRQASMSELVAKARSGKDDHADFSGKLAHLGLPAVLNVLEAEHKSGTLVLSGSHGERVEVTLREGQAAAAQLAGSTTLDDEHVMYYVLTWSVGDFRFSEHGVDVPDQIGRATIELLLEAARRQDEEREAELPSSGAPYRP